MAWEELIRKTSGRRSAYTAAWFKYPALSVNKSGLTFNGLFCDAFGIKLGTRLHALLDKEGRRIGIKLCTDAREPHDDLWTTRLATKKGTALMIGCSTVAKLFPDARGCQFRAHMNAGERVIEVSLSVDNRI